MSSKMRNISAYIIWSGAVFFYLYQYILRVSPSVMADDLMAAFEISASGFSSLSAFAVYSYALMQIPIGILVDHYGTRRMVLSSIALCVSGVTLFASTEELFLGYVARMMMGTGSACAFLSVSKIVNEWFSDSQKGMMMGMTVTCGTIGALIGGSPLVMLIESQGWRQSLLILAAIGTVVLLLNFFTLPKAQNAEKSVPGEEHTSLTILAAVFKNSQALIFAFVAVGIYLSISVVADLWGVSFVVKKFGIDKSDAAQMISFIYIGTAIGCPLIAAISRYFSTLRTTIMGGAFGIVILLAYIIYAQDISLWSARAIFFSIGFLTGAEILCFTGACSLMGPQVAATVTGLLNCIVTLAGALIQQNIGRILDYFWDGTTSASGIPVYSLHTYQVAFGVILLVSFLSFFLAWFIKPIKGEITVEPSLEKAT